MGPSAQCPRRNSSRRKALFHGNQAFENRAGAGTHRSVHAGQAQRSDLQRDADEACDGEPFGAWLAQNGVDIYTIARYMGHKSLESTKRYLHHNAESLRASIGTIEKMTEKLVRMAEIDG